MVNKMNSVELTMTASPVENENKGVNKMKNVNIVEDMNLSLNDEQVVNVMYEYIKNNPGLKKVNEKLIEEIENSYEYIEGVDDEDTYDPDTVSFRIFGIKLLAVKPERNIELYSEDLILDNLLKFIRFMESAHNYDISMKDNFLIQKLEHNAFVIFGKDDPTKENSPYKTWLGGLYFDTDDEDEFRTKLKDFRTMFMPVLGGVPSEEDIKELIERRG